ncbi:MAG: dihydrodipicolinate synthase family protein [Acidobacteriota bacterium]|nr:dihydrodipicolinate synthase family protein [Acidobacteriota bacterium]
MKLRGIIPPIGTPLTSDERVDEAGLRRLVRYLIGAGVHGVFANGTMGCFALLTDREQQRAIEIVVDEVRGRIPVVAGVSDTGTKRVIEKLREIQRLGIDYLTALPPYYFTLSQKSATSFFREIAQAAEKPLLIYNNPYLTKFNLSIEAIVNLGHEPNIVGLKETNQDCNRWVQLIEALRGLEDFSVLLGTELLIPQGLMMGADGAIGGAHNMSPQVAVELYQAVQARDYDLAYELSGRLAKVCKVFDYGEIWGGFEAALQVLGICEKTVCAPYCSATDEDRERVREILEDCGLLQSESLAKGQAD